MYPEGTRSRSGNMLTPKSGFVKLAIKARVPIVPIAMKGTYEILSPDQKVPRLRKCDVYILDKIYVSPINLEFYDVFFRRSGTDRKYGDLDEAEMQEIAFRIMEKIRIVSGQTWDKSVVWPNLDIPDEIMKRKQSWKNEKTTT